MAATHVAYEIDGWGVGELWIAAGQVVWHELPHPAAPGVVGRAGDPSLTPTHPRGRGTVGDRGAPDRDDLAPRVVGTLQAFFAGEEVELNAVPVDLEYESEFHERCAKMLRTVPRGEVVTYGELASLAGSPGAARAAGSFCARNRLALFVPCHRVVAASGLGSYGSLGIGYKQRLLALERTDVPL